MMENKRYTIEEGGVLHVADGVTIIHQDEFKGFDQITQVVLPRTVCFIEYGAFHDCKRMKSINIPRGVNIIESWAFAHCESLKEVDLPEGLRRIGSSAFLSCHKLKKVLLPSTLEKIEKSAFEDCRSLKQIVVPSSTELQSKHFLGYFYSPFDHCDALERVIIRDVKPRINKNAVKHLVLMENPPLYQKSWQDLAINLFGVIVESNPDEKVSTAYAQVIAKDLLYASFRCSAAYLDWEEDRDFGSATPLSEVIGYDGHRIAIVGMPRDASPKIMSIKGVTYLIDEDFYKEIITNNNIE